MARIRLNELTAFVEVAQHRSFTKAAAQMGIASSTISETIGALEKCLGVRLFNRTTRSVAVTAAGEQLLTEVQPMLEGIDHAIDRINLFRDKPTGILRLAASRPFGIMFLSPVIAPFLTENPGIVLEISMDDTLGDIVNGRFDAGIRVGHRLEQDMTVLRIGDPFRMVAVAAPSYLERHGHPTHPKDLYAHNCIVFRTPWDQRILPWYFTQEDEHIELTPAGNLIFNDADLRLNATLDGVGVGYLPEPIAAPLVAQGQLVHLLESWSRTVDGVFLYHYNRRQTPMPLAAFIRFISKWRRSRR